MQNQDEEENSNEEEWQEIKKKFETEGIDFHISSRNKVLYLWRWLVDADHNLSTSRKMLDKLREQQTEEMTEVEKYVEHIRHLSNDKIEKLEQENNALRQEVEKLRLNSVDRVSQEISEMLNRESLTEIVNLTIAEQVAYLLVLRSRLMEELEVEQHKASDIANLTDSVKLTSTQFQQMLEEQKVDFEEELRNERELTKKVKEELKRTHDSEIAQLQLKLAATQKRVDDLEEHRNLQNNDSDSCAKNVVNDEFETLDAIQSKDKLFKMEERVKKLEYIKRQLENDNESLTYKLTELLNECEEKESQLRHERMKKVGAKTMSQQNSLTESPKHFQNHLENNKNKSNVDTLWIQQMKKLQQDVENLQEQLASVGGRHEALAVRYQQRKADGRTKIQKIKDVFQAKQSNLKDQITELENALTMVRTSLGWEKECRQKIQTDFASLQKEKGDLMKRLLENEENLRDKSIQIKSLSARLDHLEKENTKISQEMTLFKKLVLQEVMNASNKSAQEESKKKVAIAHWPHKSSGQRSKLEKLERMLVPANPDRQEVQV